MTHARIPDPRRPAPHRRARAVALAAPHPADRLLDLAANALAAVAIVGGGIVLTGLATLL